MNLDDLRKRIDECDLEILRLLNERARCALEIAEIKRVQNTAFYVPEREKAIFDRLRKFNAGPLPDAAVKGIYREIISAVRALERPVSIAFFGAKATFTHMAALRLFGSHAEYHPMPTIDDVFTEVERKRCDYGVVPVETASGGGVSDTLDRFIVSDLHIVNEIMMHIKQNLLSNTPFELIKRVYSKSQGFVQCRNWLKANLPNADQIETSSTAEAAQIAANEEGAAAIASELAAELYNIKILVPGIEDAANNFTRFFVIGHQMSKRTGQDKTSILCAIKDRPGALYSLLNPLASRGINLTKIESRPSQRKAWEYVFFIDMLGHVEDPNLKEGLEEVAAFCKEVKILGSYPRGELEE